MVRPRVELALIIAEIEPLELSRGNPEVSWDVEVRVPSCGWGSPPDIPLSTGNIRRLQPSAPERGMKCPWTWGLQCPEGQDKAASTSPYRGKSWRFVTG